MRVQALGPQGTVEAFDVRIVGRLARPAEIDLHPILIRPQVHDLTGKPRSIITKEHLGGSTPRTDPIEHLDYMGPFQRWSHLNRQAFPGEYIYDRQHPEPPPVDQLVCHKVQTPDLVGSCGPNPLPPMLRHPPPSFGPLFTPQSFFFVQSL